MDTCEALRHDLERALSIESPCGTPALLAARARAEALAAPACAKDVLARRGLPVPGRLAADRQAPPLPANKTVRDAMAPLLEVYETENFAIKYGPNFTGTGATLGKVGTAFETAWAEEIGGMGFVPPDGADAYKFNVYLGDTGNGAPSASGTSGYYYTDDEGYGYVVLSRDTVADDEWLRATAAHEFNHALQDAAHTYAYEGQGAWYWEASAMFVEGVVVPDSDAYAAFLPAFALRPDLPVNHFVYPDGSLESLHQYGAFLFVQHLVEIEQGGDPTIVRRSWLEATPGADPLVVLDRLLAEDGGSREAGFAEAAARAATFDWADEAAYEAVIDDWGGFDHPESTRPSGTILGPDGVPHAPEAPPRTYGANYWKALAVTEPFVLRFEGSDDPEWRVTVATQTGDVHERIDVPVVDGRGEARVDVGDAGQVWIAVSAADGPVDDETEYDYTLTLAPDEPEPEDSGDTGEERRACGCATGGGPAGLFGLAAVMITRRRRR